MKNVTAQIRFECRFLTNTLTYLLLRRSLERRTCWASADVMLTFIPLWLRYFLLHVFFLRPLFLSNFRQAKHIDVDRASPKKVSSSLPFVLLRSSRSNYASNLQASYTNTHMRRAQYKKKLSCVQEILCTGCTAFREHFPSTGSPNLA